MGTARWLIFFKCVNTCYVGWSGKVNDRRPAGRVEWFLSSCRREKRNLLIPERSNFSRFWQPDKFSESRIVQLCSWLLSIHISSFLKKTILQRIHISNQRFKFKGNFTSRSISSFKDGTVPSLRSQYRLWNFTAVLMLWRPGVVRITIWDHQKIYELYLGDQSVITKQMMYRTRTCLETFVKYVNLSTNLHWHFEIFKVLFRIVFLKKIIKNINIEEKTRGITKFIHLWLILLRGKIASDVR